MAEFKLPPLSPLAGSNLRTFISTLKHGHVEPGKIPVLLVTLIVILFSTPFQWIDEIYYRWCLKKKKIKNDPVFIIGHWRSGTTILHNILARDKQMGYITTYQSVFPNNLKSKFIFRSFMKVHIPEKRPGDNVRLSVNFPQEDEFALSNMIPFSYYQFMYLPGVYEFFYEQYIRFAGKPEIKRTWIRNYRKMIQKGLHNTGRERPLLKNPCNTGRIDLLLEMFPGARFIHIVRNPIIVFLSTRKFLAELLPTMWLHELEAAAIDDMILTIYERIMKDHIRLKSLIPPENYIELRFEEFDQRPMDLLEKIYTGFGIENYKEARPAFEAYIQSKSGYLKNKYISIDSDLLNRLLDRWGFAMKYWNYDVPDHLEITGNKTVTQ